MAQDAADAGFAPPNLHVLRAADIAAHAQTFSHPWSEDSEITGTMLARATGLKRTGVSLARLAPGKRSFPYHSHRFEEEWLYVISGRGIARIDGVECEIAAGDFVGFPAPGSAQSPGVAHTLVNPGPEELVYLMGGENREFEIAEFPDLGRRMVRAGGDVQVYEADAARGL